LVLPQDTSALLVTDALTLGEDTTSNADLEVSTSSILMSALFVLKDFTALLILVATEELELPVLKALTTPVQEELNVKPALLGTSAVIKL
jgi:hypothetical protein